MNRDESLRRLRERGAGDLWDFVVIGGGATGAGIAVDAASRGYSVALLEAADWGKGTSSRATKLIHGGVRYLQQGNVSLVTEALRERGLLLRNAPHLVSKLELLIPGYAWWEMPFYGVGLKLYDLLAGRLSFGPSRLCSARTARESVGTLEARGLRGGVRYFDGQFDDSRLLINLVQTAAEHGACAVNYARVGGLLKEGGRVAGVMFRDEETGAVHEVRGRCVVNAAGPFCDELRRLDDPAAAPMLSHSQGVHLVLPRAFLPGDTALMVPRTSDGRVLFAIPWHGHVVVGTTDTPIDAASAEPRAQPEEIDFLLDTVGAYLTRRPGRGDILSVFTGIRPLVRKEGTARTASLSRDHTVAWSDSGLVTITGGKWTTYRRMAEDLVDRAAARAGLPSAPCRTKTLPVHGAPSPGGPNHPRPAGDPLAVYGTDAAALESLIAADTALGRPLHPDLPLTGAQSVWAARREMARTVEDVLARRTRALFLNARAALDMAPAVASLLARELGRGPDWEVREVRRFAAVAAGFLPDGVAPPTPFAAAAPHPAAEGRGRGLRAAAGGRT